MITICEEPGSISVPAGEKASSLLTSPSCSGDSTPRFGSHPLVPTHDLGLGLGSEDIVPVTILERTQADRHPSQAPPAPQRPCASVPLGQPLAFGCEAGLITSLLLVGGAESRPEQCLLMEKLILPALLSLHQT